jgi:hypothetical protein
MCVNLLMVNVLMMNVLVMNVLMMNVLMMNVASPAPINAIDRERHRGLASAGEPHAACFSGDGTPKRGVVRDVLVRKGACAGKTASQERDPRALIPSSYG